MQETQKQLSDKHFRQNHRKAPYGICHRCNAPVNILGLEAFKCSGGCGWVSRRAEKSIELHRPVQVITLTPVHKTEASLLDLIAGGAQ